MGQKVNPVGLRVGILNTWESNWFEGTKYADYLHSDLRIRKYIESNCANSGISKVIINRSVDKINIEIYTSKPGVIIGKGGAELDQLKAKLIKLANGQSNLTINIVSVKKPELDSKIVADSIARQIEKRVSYKRAMKKSMQSAMKCGALGIRINISGRIGGAEIARMEWYREGRVPLHTLRADVDYALGEAKTTYGICGIKVWIYRGNVEANNEPTQVPKKRIGGK